MVVARPNCDLGLPEWVSTCSPHQCLFNWARHWLAPHWRTPHWLAPHWAVMFTARQPDSLISTIHSDNTMAKTPAKRSKTLIDSEVQGGLLRRVALHWILFFVANTLALMVWVGLFEQPDASWRETMTVTVQRFLPFFVITMTLIPAFVWDTLKLSHRFAGPILRLRNTLIDMKAGRAVRPLKFRDNDFWQELAGDFNDVMRMRHEAANQEAGHQESGEQDHAKV